MNEFTIRVVKDRAVKTVTFSRNGKPFYVAHEKFADHQEFVQGVILILDDAWNEHQENKP